MKKIYIILHFIYLLFCVNNVSFAQVVANDETFDVVYGSSQITAGNFLTNDTRNGSQATTTNVTISLVFSTSTGVSISGSNVIVAAGTPQGTYTLIYQICDIANPTICDTGIVTLNTQLQTYDQNRYFWGCFGEGNIVNGGNFGGQNSTLNGVPVVLEPYYTQPGNVLVPANVVLTINYNWCNAQIQPNGNFNIWSNGPPFCQINYTLCEIANPNNCKTATLYIQFQPYSNIIAQNDNFSLTPINNTIGGTTPSVLANDFMECGGGIWDPILSPISFPPGFTLNTDGTINVAIGTAPGTYLLNYYVTNNNSLGMISQATATVVVTGISSLVANYDNFNSNYTNTNTASVLLNDTLNGSLITNPSVVILTALNNPVGFTLNTDGTISIAANVLEGTYTVPYQICNPTSPTDCYVNYAYIVVFKNRILGKVKFDSNNNGCNNNDAYINNIKFKNVNGSVTYSSTTSNYNDNQYYLIGDVGTNTVSIDNLPSYFSITPANQVFNFSTPGTTTAADFCISATSNVNDLEVVAIPKTNVIPGFFTYYDIWYKNNGSTMLSGQVAFQYDGATQSFITSDPSPNFIASGLLSYNFSNLAPFESRLITNIKFQAAPPPALNSGDASIITSTVSPIIADATPINNTSTLNQIVVNSQDPNDIVVHEGNTITLAKAQQDYLHYTIRFQNIGTSNAINIKVLNDLDANLDWSTFQFLSASHNCRIKNNNNHNEFLFEGINLPGTENEPLSHGYITFKVKPIASIAIGNIISSMANIYFDYNAPIATNQVSTVVVSNLAIENVVFNDFKYYPNPVKNTLSISNNYIINKIEISSLLGQVLIHKKTNELQSEINLVELPNGIYFVKIGSENCEKMFKILKE
ncbi:MAG: T9SS type A sorting domain-containing protein [Flavobacterium sp.]|uniref:T9SS type A sorting domain-containing protein n=1 Tax=Flavobacterium sp. TaxID=239 RepID=UPI003BBCBD66